jgi:hypothetical protein
VGEPDETAPHMAEIAPPFAAARPKILRFGAESETK